MTDAIWKRAAKAGIDAAATEEYLHLLNTRSKHIVEVDQPMVLITQAPRSGGTLLMRLLDGHPECHTVGHEFSFALGLSKPLAPDTDKGWEYLHDDSLAKSFRKGFGQAHANLHGDDSRYPMLIPPSLQRRIYDEQLAKIDEPAERDVLNAYLTSFFNAWLDNQNLYGRARKKWVTAFTPRAIASGMGRPGRAPSRHKIDRFQELYPDGRLISVVRDPVTWYASARRWSHRNEWARVEDAIETWCACVQQALTLYEEHREDLILIVSFEDLLKHTAETMSSLAKQLEIRPGRELHQPTFNRMPIRANSSFKAGPPRVTSAPLDRGDQLRADEVAYIRERAWDLFERAEAVALRRERTASGKKARKGPEETPENPKPSPKKQPAPKP